MQCHLLIRYCICMQMNEHPRPPHEIRVCMVGTRSPSLMRQVAKIMSIPKQRPSIAYKDLMATIEDQGSEMEQQGSSRKLMSWILDD